MLRFAVLCLLYGAACALAAQPAPPPSPSNLSGTWFGSVVVQHVGGKASHDTAVLILLQHGTTITGSVGSTVDQQSAFTDGSVTGGHIRFHVSFGGGLNFDLRLVAGHLQGSAVGKTITAQLNVEPAPGLLPHAELQQEIEKVDMETFNAFDSCDVDGYARHLSSDIEFFQDRTGETGYKDNLQRLRDRCAEGILLRREVDPASLIINEVPGYGAIEAGIQRFYSRSNDGSEHLDATVRFTMVWKMEDGVWKLTRVMSYDHH